MNSLLTESFNRINSGRSIPTLTPHDVVIQRVDGFQSYQFMQINPDTRHHSLRCEVRNLVSIVSIQADQSRLVHEMQQSKQHAGWFQSYQFRQINPDNHWHNGKRQGKRVSIVSIHADQSRQLLCLNTSVILRLSFNRINSCRSIQT